MKKRLYKLSSVVLAAGMISSAIIVLAKDITENSDMVLATEITDKNNVVFEEIQESRSQYPEFTYSKDWNAEESYMLAKIAMSEAESESIQTKTLVILTVLNRVHSEVFPDTIYDVIFQYDSRNDVYQYSPVMPGGRWWTTEPNEDCWEAVNVVMEAKYDYSGGALFFESCNYDNWHSRNLDFLYQSGNMKFYK